MNTYKEQETKSLAAAAGTLQQKGSGSALGFTDNRPGAVAQRKLHGMLNTRPQQTIQKKAAGTVIQRETTVSGHGDLKRDQNGDFAPYTVPQGKTIVLSAPPGATLGNISMTLNETQDPDPAALRGLIKVNTNADIWKNTVIPALLLADQNVLKTPTMVQALTDLNNGTDYANLLPGRKNALRALEERQSFEIWAHNYVAPHTFSVINEGEDMTDMDLTSFEQGLRSQNNAQQNDYIENATTLSDYVDAHHLENRFFINACSAALGQPYTGFQIDLA